MTKKRQFAPFFADQVYQALDAACRETMEYYVLHGDGYFLIEGDAIRFAFDNPGVLVEKEESLRDELLWAVDRYQERDGKVRDPEARANLKRMREVLIEVIQKVDSALDRDETVELIAAVSEGLGH